MLMMLSVDKMILSILLIASLYFSVVHGYTFTNTTKKCITDYSFVDKNDKTQTLSICYKLVTGHVEEDKHLGNYTYPYHTMYNYSYFKGFRPTVRVRSTNSMTITIGQEGHIDYGVDGVYNRHRVRMQKSYLDVPKTGRCKRFTLCDRDTKKIFIDSYTFDCTNLPFGRKSKGCEPILPFFYPYTIELLQS